MNVTYTRCSRCNAVCASHEKACSVCGNDNPTYGPVEDFTLRPKGHARTPIVNPSAKLLGHDLDVLRQAVAMAKAVDAPQVEFECDLADGMGLSGLGDLIRQFLPIEVGELTLWVGRKRRAVVRIRLKQ